MENGDLTLSEFFLLLSMWHVCHMEYEMWNGEWRPDAERIFFCLCKVCNMEYKMWNGDLTLIEFVLPM